MAGKTILQHQVTGRSTISVVSCEVAHALNQRAGRLGILPSDTSFWPANEGLRRTDGTRGGPSSSEGGGRRRRAGKTFHHLGVRARRFGRTCCFRGDQEGAATRSRPMTTFEPGTLCVFYRHYPGKRADTAMGGRYLGPAASIGPHGRSSWWVRFGGRANLCASEHLREITPDVADRLGIDSWTRCSGQPRSTAATQPQPHNRWIFRQNHRGNPRSCHAVTWMTHGHS